MTKLCKCGCGTEIANNRTYVNGHNWKGKKHTDTTRKKMMGHEVSDITRNKISESKMGHEVSDITRNRISESKMGIKPSDDTRKKMSESQKGHKHSDVTKAKMSRNNGMKDPEIAEKISESKKKYYSEMDDPGQEMCNHHYIYDFNDLTKYTIPVTRSEHMSIHNNLRQAGLKVPCINIMKGE